MRYGIITDIHNNVIALRIVLKQLDQMGCDGIICCGDIIGIGPCPEETVRELIHLPRLMSVRGNHEGYLLEGMPAEYPNDENMSFDDVFVFQLEEHKIEIPDDSFSKSNTSDEPKIYQILREDAKYGTDISMTFTAKNHEEAKRYAHKLAIKALQNEYNNNPNADWEKAWISFYEGSSGDDYRIVAGIDLDNISDTLNYNVTYTLHELDSVKDCKHTASITEEENKLLNLTYKINKDGIFETDMKTVFEMLKNGVTLEEITNKINDLLDG